MLNKRGFTMVELLVVLVIIGILAAVATPVYMANTNKARASEAVATMSLIRQALRDQFVAGTAYYDVADITAAPTTGVGVNVGVAQYFSNASFSVDAGGASDKFTNPGPVDFVIEADGDASEVCGAASTDCAVKEATVVDYCLQMDNSGRVRVVYSGGCAAAAADWQEY